LQNTNATNRLLPVMPKQMAMPFAGMTPAFAN